MTGRQGETKSKIKVKKKGIGAWEEIKKKK